MKKNHTPGEWMFSKNSSDFSVYSDKKAADIALVRNTSREISDEEAEANARLIAAAPELLENLARIIDRIEESKLQDHFPSAYKRALYAIDKALNPYA
jgi:hypothetical protein